MKEFAPLMHRVQVYETDLMGITHHANYLHWLEEARIDLMRQMGFPYEKLNAEGVASPVISLNIDYKASTTFGDVVLVESRLLTFNGVILEIGYTIKKGETVAATAVTRHTFVDEAGHIVRLKRDHSAFYEKIMSFFPEKNENLAGER